MRTRDIQENQEYTGEPGIQENQGYRRTRDTGEPKIQENQGYMRDRDL